MIKISRLGSLSAFYGVAIVLLGTALAAVVYRDHAGLAYSPFNHFVSELGHSHTSVLSPLFNICLVVGNGCLVPFTFAVARQMGGKLGRAFGSLGIVAISPARWAEFFP